MQTLSTHIEYLLLHHDCVVLPGFGAFINVRTAARYDSSARVWHPMMREVRFNPALTHDDGMLSNSYARKYVMSYAEARDLSAHDVRLLSDMLIADGEVTLGNLGILRRNEEGIISFEPARTAEAYSAMLGYMPVKRYSHRASTSRGDVKEEELPAAKERRFDTVRNYYIAINKRAARVAAAVMLVAVVGLTFLLPHDSSTHIDKAAVIPVEKMMPRKPALQPAAESQLANEIIEEETPADEPSYHLIVATFHSRSEAETFLKEKESSAYKLTIHSTKKMHRVAAMSSDSAEKLYSLCNDKEFTRIFPQAWVWHDND